MCILLDISNQANAKCKHHVFLCGGEVEIETVSHTVAQVGLKLCIPSCTTLLFSAFQILGLKVWATIIRSDFGLCEAKLALVLYYIQCMMFPRVITTHPVRYKKRKEIIVTWSSCRESVLGERGKVWGRGREKMGAKYVLEKGVLRWEGQRDERWRTYGRLIEKDVQNFMKTTSQN